MSTKVVQDPGRSAELRELRSRSYLTRPQLSLSVRQQPQFALEDGYRMLAWIVGLALTGPLLGILAIVADRFSGGHALTRRRFVSAAAVGGALGFAPAGCVVAIAPEGSAFFVGLPLAAVAGALFGALCGTLASVVWGASARNRDPAA
jgi:hypothetical protein